MVPHEINHPEPGGIAVLGRDPGWEEERDGRPFVGVGGRILDDCFSEASIKRSSVNILNVSRIRPPGNVFEAHNRESLASEIAETRRLLERLRPRLIIALGNEASWVTVPDWPDARSEGRLTHVGNIFGATGIEERRGYIFDSSFDCPVLVTIHPAAVSRVWKPWRVLLSYDLQKAKEVFDAKHLRRPVREVEIITSDRGARLAVEALRHHRRLAADIETYGDSSLACIGFAGEGGKAFVFPAQYLSRAGELLGSPDVTTIWANGIYDLFVLKHRYGVSIRGRVDDVQLKWHAAYAELAGKAEEAKAHKMTRKSLAFLASLATYDEWWKGVYETEEEFFIYNGRDCAITFDVDTWVQGHVDAMGAQEVYEHERRLMWPCVDMLARGLRVDEALRTERIGKIQERYDTLHSEINEVAVPLIVRERERLEALGMWHLFEETEPTCSCCRHAKKKQQRCWGCAGFDHAPSKADLVARGGDAKKTKAELEEEMLGTCQVCGGEERKTKVVFNPNSDAQQKAVLYEVLRLPVRTKDGKATTDEGALKSLTQFVS